LNGLGRIKSTEKTPEAAVGHSVFEDKDLILINNRYIPCHENRQMEEGGVRGGPRVIWGGTFHG
jgi:hypothetical protein